MIRSYQLQLAGYRYIITGNEWFTSDICFNEEIEFFESIGVAIIYPEHDLLWICGMGEEETERFKTLEDFERELNALPRWEMTRYAVVETPNMLDNGRERMLINNLFLFDCSTGQPLIRDCEKPAPGREAEVARLRRGIELMMRGEHFSLYDPRR